jgi:uncharacterized protein
MEAIGISFPFRISPSTGGVQTARWNDSGDITLIKQSIIQIIATRFGERTVEKTFGTDLVTYVFDPMDDVLQQGLQYAVMKALSSWEPRISVIGLEFFTSPDDGAVLLQINFQVTRSGMQDTVSIPI